MIVIVLMVFGVISLGDVLSVVFYIFMGILLLILIGVLTFRHRINRLRKEAERQAAEGQHTGGYAAGGAYARGGRRERRPEGEVTVERTAASRDKVVSNEIGSYVEYEEIEIEEEETGS